jgi:putative acetyltransferase
MFTSTHTTSQNPDFLALVTSLDSELAIRNGDANDFFAQFNKVDHIQHVIVAYEGNLPVGCGAIKAFEENAMEVKRMYVLPEKRGLGIAGIILHELEIWAKALGCQRCVLETGDDMLAAVRLYEKAGYQRIPNYGQYADVQSSVCFEKRW